MNTNKKVLIGVVGVTVVIGDIAIGLLLSKMPEKVDLSTIHIEAATEAPRETLPAVTQTPEAEETTEGQEDTVSGVSASIGTYTSGKVSIQYPVMDQMGDASKKDKANELLKISALSFVKISDIDEANDILDIKCRVISADRECLTAIHTGTLSVERAVHSVNLPHSDTINLLQTQDPGLDDPIDAYTMAGYVLSDDVKFSGISSNVEVQVLSYRPSVDLDPLTAVFNSVDFPPSPETRWPGSSSYEKQGTTHFSLPIPHALGGYMLVAFDPTTRQSFNRD